MAMNHTKLQASLVPPLMRWALQRQSHGQRQGHAGFERAHQNQIEICGSSFIVYINIFFKYVTIPLGVLPRSSLRLFHPISNQIGYFLEGGQLH